MNKETIIKIIGLIDERKEELTNNDYVEMCNFLKFVYDIDDTSIELEKQILEIFSINLNRSFDL